MNKISIKIIQKFTPHKHPLRTRFRAWIIGCYLKFLMKLGYVVLIEGATGSGKSFLLSHMLPKKVILDGILLTRDNPWIKVDLNISLVPKVGLWAIDEIGMFNQSTVYKVLNQCRGRGFGLTFQTVDYMNNEIAHELTHHKIMFIHLEDDLRPKDITEQKSKILNQFNGRVVSSTITNISLEVFNVVNPSETNSNLPSHLFPGCGTSYADFRILSNHIFNRIEASELLAKVYENSYIRDYDKNEGSFYLIDEGIHRQGIFDVELSTIKE